MGRTGGVELERVRASLRPISVLTCAGRRRWATAAIVWVLASLLLGCSAAVPSHPYARALPPTRAVDSAGNGWRWAAYRDVEVKVPARWPDAYAPSSPGCGDGSDAPTTPYVTYDDASRVYGADGCARQRQVEHPGPAFGLLPFRLWVPYVEFDEPRPDLTVGGQSPDRRDADATYRGWHLTRTTTHGIQLTVLSGPGDGALAHEVLGSLRTVRTTHLGCPTGSTVLDRTPEPPVGAQLPAPSEITAVTICDYTRGVHSVGLSGSRRIEGRGARQLVRAVRDAPAGSGPNSPPTACTQPPLLDRALVLRFYGSRSAPDDPVTEAYVFFDACTGHGILDPAGMRQLTTADCKPLFTTPPIGLWAAESRVYVRCGEYGATG